MTQLFASDNASAAHPEILKALSEVSRDHVISYGDDASTARAREQVKRLFGGECGVYFVYNGTGANVTALRATVGPHEAVLCNEMAHINEDEGGAVEALGGIKLLSVHRDDGKLTIDQLAPYLARKGFVHTSQPAVVSITQPTEVGALYSLSELRTLCDEAHEAGLVVHMDGARIANAVAALASPSEEEAILRAMTVGAGVDILSFGATKNGLLFGEAVVFFRKVSRVIEAERIYPFIRKQTTQLNSKMRYIAAQFERYLTDNLWIENARTANEGARRLANGLERIPGCELVHRSEANGVFVRLPTAVIEPLQREFGFYLWDEDRGVARLMCSWDTQPEVIDRFLERAAGLVSAIDRMDGVRGSARG